MRPHWTWVMAGIWKLSCSGVEVYYLEYKAVIKMVVLCQALSGPANPWSTVGTVPRAFDAFGGPQKFILKPEGKEWSFRRWRNVFNAEVFKVILVGTSILSGMQSYPEKCSHMLIPLPSLGELALFSLSGRKWCERVCRGNTESQVLVPWA